MAALGARHGSGISLHHQMLSNRDVAATNNNVPNQNSGQVSLPPPTVYGTAAATNIPRYGGNIPVNNMNMMNYPADTRKRLRDYGFDPIDEFRGSCNPSLSGGGHSSIQIPQQQFNIDRFICENTERMRIEIEEHRQRCFREAAQAAEAVVRQRLKSKEEELVRIANRNKALEGRVESLTLDNQKWRRLAQRNEATMSALRRDLQQAVAERQQLIDAAGEGDTASHCGSNCEEEDAHARLCRRCERAESCVVLLPCGHMCLCAKCAASTNACPVCNINL